MGIRKLDFVIKLFLFQYLYEFDTILDKTEAEFKEFERRLKYGWFHLKLYLIFQDLSRRSIDTGFWQI